MPNKHVVTYLGAGVWKDANGESWGGGFSNSEIKAERAFETEGTKEEFLEERPDIKFMVGYNQMKIFSTSDVEVKPAKKVVEPTDGDKEPAKTEKSKVIIK